MINEVANKLNISLDNVLGLYHNEKEKVLMVNEMKLAGRIVDENGVRYRSKYQAPNIKQNFPNHEFIGV
jgi:hypothetical protein